MGPAVVQTTIGSCPKIPSRLSVVRLDQQVAEQVQPQVGVGRGCRGRVELDRHGRELHLHIAARVGPELRRQLGRDGTGLLAGGRGAEGRRGEPGVEHGAVGGDRGEAEAPGGGHGPRVSARRLAHVPALDLTATTVELTRQLVDIESVSGNEGPIADAVEAALRPLAHLEVHARRRRDRRAHEPGARPPGRDRRASGHRARERQPAVPPRCRRHPVGSWHRRHEGRAARSC